MINQPPHYNSGEIECIDYIKDRMSVDEFIGYLWGNVIKYNHRWKDKGGIEDLRKSQWYSKKLSEVIDGSTKKTEGDKQDA